MNECIVKHKSSLYRELKEKNPDKLITAMVAGSFDLIHPGYVYTFEEATRHCDKFIIFLQQDPAATRNTKYRPIIPYYERYKTLISIEAVDEVYMYQTEDELHNLIELFKPAVRILGEDYLGQPFTGDDLPPKVVYTTRSHEWSTTKIKNRIAAMTIAQNPELLEKVNLKAILKGDFSSIES
jgi:glycerol-3-phosphate cytidylyltransferase